MYNIKEIWNNNKNKSFVIVTGCFLVFVFMFTALSHYTSRISDNIDSGWESTIKVETKDGKTFVSDSDLGYKIEVKRSSAKDRVFSRIISYLNEVKRRRDKHDRTMVFFYEQYFLFNMMQAIMVMATTIIGLVVSKFGWDKINKNILYIFL